MAFKNIKRDSLIIFFVQLVTWSFTYSLPVKEEAHMITTFDWDQFTWLRRSTTPKPFDWDKSTLFRRYTTPKPFDWDQSTSFRRYTTRKPFDWDKFTLPTWFFTWPTFTTPRPFIWNRITFSPDVYKPRPSSTPEPLVWFIVGGVILIVLLLSLIKYACSMHNSSSTAYDSSPTLHLPPATTIRPVDRHVQLPPENRPGNTLLFVLPTSTNLEGIMPNYPTTSNASSMYSASDKPPDYSEVVISDFVDENKKFKEVSPKPLDTPPPKYGDQNLQRY